MSNKSYMVTIPVIRYYACYVHDVADEKEAQSYLDGVLRCEPDSAVNNLKWANGRIPDWQCDELPGKNHPCVKDGFAWDFEELDND